MEENNISSVLVHLVPCSRNHAKLHGSISVTNLSIWSVWNELNFVSVVAVISDASARRPLSKIDKHEGNKFFFNLRLFFSRTERPWRLFLKFDLISWSFLFFPRDPKLFLRLRSCEPVSPRFTIGQTFWWAAKSGPEPLGTLPPLFASNVSKLTLNWECWTCTLIYPRYLSPPPEAVNWPN